MIPASELILNSRGAIYHLDLLPEEIADTVILVGDPGRVTEVSRHFERVEIVRQTREFITHTGYHAGKRLTVLSTGIGTDNIDIVLSELDALVNIDLASRTVNPQPAALRFFRAGTSGALQEDVAVDSILVSSHGLGLDNLMNFYTHPVQAAEERLLQDFREQLSLPAGSASPYLTAGSAGLIALFPGLRQGITVTCPGFYGPQGRTLRAVPKDATLIDRLSAFRGGGHRLTNFEMETAGIYGMSRMLGHEAVSLNAILANRVTGTFSPDPKKTVDGMIELLLATL